MIRVDTRFSRYARASGADSLGRLGDGRKWWISAATSSSSSRRGTRRSSYTVLERALALFRVLLARVRRHSSAARDSLAAHPAAARQECKESREESINQSARESSEGVDRRRRRARVAREVKKREPADLATEGRCLRAGRLFPSCKQRDDARLFAGGKKSGPRRKVGHRSRRQMRPRRSRTSARLSGRRHSRRQIGGDCARRVQSWARGRAIGAAAEAVRFFPTHENERGKKPGHRCLAPPVEPRPAG